MLFYLLHHTFLLVVSFFFQNNILSHIIPAVGNKSAKRKSIYSSDKLRFLWRLLKCIPFLYISASKKYKKHGWNDVHKTTYAENFIPLFEIVLIKEMKQRRFIKKINKYEIFEFNYIDRYEIRSDYGRKKTRRCCYAVGYRIYDGRMIRRQILGILHICQWCCTVECERNADHSDDNNCILFDTWERNE